jgi:hypothetical protein
MAALLREQGRSEADKGLAAGFAGPGLDMPVELFDAADGLTEDEEPISPAVLRDSLRALKLVSALQPGHTPEQRGRAIGACDIAAIFLEAELKRVGLA